MLVFFNLIRTVKIFCKYGLLIQNKYLGKSIVAKILGILLTCLFYPLALIKKSNLSFEDRITESIKELGPIYIKLGQTLAVRPDICGVELAECFKTLQDKLPYFDYELVEQEITRSLQGNIQELFIDFEKKPVAAASIAQVHKASIYQDSEIKQVAVKVLRPGIREIYQRDIDLFRLAAFILTKIFDQFKRLRLNEVVEVFQETMNLELNLKLEAAAASELWDNSQDQLYIYIPKIFWSLTSENILTSEWIDGTPIYDLDRLKTKGFDLKELSRNITVMFFNQAYRYGFFHADLHHGNILIMNDGTVALIDFGITSRIYSKDRLAIAEILLSFIKRDYLNIAKIHLRAGYIPPETDIGLFAQYCRAVSEPIIGLQVNQISIGKLLADLFKITKKFGMETQPQLLILQKTMVVIEGIGRSLDPEINMWELAEPWIKDWANKNISPEAKIFRVIKEKALSLLEEIN
jgi:ubiquinone biosynthesis protein